MGDKSEGLYPQGKFIVQRRDGRDADGERHAECDYFVLDLSHDTHAMPALRAYAASARRDGYELLANDLDAIAGTDTTTVSDAHRKAAEEILEWLNFDTKLDAVQADVYGVWAIICKYFPSAQPVVSKITPEFDDPPAPPRVTFHLSDGSAVCYVREDAAERIKLNER